MMAPLMPLPLLVRSQFVTVGRPGIVAKPAETRNALAEISRDDFRHARSDKLSQKEPPMRSHHLLALCLSPLVLATSLFTGLSIGGNESQAGFLEAQSLQPPFPSRISLSKALQQSRPDETPPLQDKQAATAQHEPTAAEISKKETVAAAFLRGFQYQEYEVRSAAEAMPEEKYGYRPAEGKFKSEKPEFGPAEVRTFAEQVKHVACSNFGFAAELDGQKPPDACDKGGPSPAKTKKELLTYLRDSFAAARKSLAAIDAKNMFEPIEGPYAGPNTRLGIATVIVWHNADHYGQMVLYMRENGIVPPASRPNPPKLSETY
jgi:uncharacterized damage-inducible protein DinB